MIKSHVLRLVDFEIHWWAPMAFRAGSEHQPSECHRRCSAEPRRAQLRQLRQNLPTEISEIWVKWIVQREFPLICTVWPYMAQYLHFRSLEFPLIVDQILSVILAGFTTSIP
jgi:hypothetical protein